VILKGSDKKRVSFPIGVKLMLIISTLLIFSLGAITFMVSVLVSADIRVSAEDNNFTQNKRTAAGAESFFQGVLTNTRAQLDMLSLLRGERATNSSMDFFFQENPFIAALVPGAGELVNKTFFDSRGLEPKGIGDFAISNREALARAAAGEELLLNAGSFFGVPMLALIFPTPDSLRRSLGGGRAAAGAAICFFSPENLKDAFDSGANVSFLINDSGDILIHSGMPVGEGAGGTLGSGDRSFVRSAMENGSRSFQTIFTDETGNSYFGAYQKIDMAGAMVLTRIALSDVLKDLRGAIRRNILISAAVMAFAVFVIFLFSKNISNSLKALTRASEMIEEGNYNLVLKPKGQDEIGVLTQTFIGMGHGLENFEKFTNKEMVQLARQGKLERTGEGKTGVVCFIMLRQFSEVSAGMDAKDMVAFVNSFLSRIVPCITSAGGTVDKFLTQEGVVVMALWGAVKSSGRPSDDALACIQAVLMMRAVLRNWNIERAKFRSSGKERNRFPRIKIGCGINIGEVVSGQMGSDERMEYTVIGDAVNLAARIEGPNDLFDTDILITENMQSLIGDALLTEEMPSLEVKGKEKPLRVFAVVNLKDPKESAAILAKLDHILNIDPRLSRKCVGPSGPRTMKDLRAAWQAVAGLSASRDRGA
jgi:adenylate cyclase